MKTPTALAITLLLHLLPTAHAAPQDFDVEAAPFTAIRWTDDDPPAPEVRIEGEWFGWQGIDALEVAELTDFCRATWPELWQKRVGEDLVEAMALMGSQPGATVRMRLVELESGKPLTLEDVRMTEDNRRAVWQDNRDRDIGPAPVLDFGAFVRPEFATLSPFTAVVPDGETTRVRLDGSWYRLLELDGLSLAELRAYCSKTYGAKADKRFAEDLVEVLAGMGHAPGTHVDLVLEELESGARIELEGVEMTEEKRASVWRFRQLAGGTSSATGTTPRIDRAHASLVDARFAYLAEPLDAGAWPNGPELTREAAMRDLDQLEWLIQNVYAYRDLVQLDFRAALDTLRLGLAPRVPLGAFATRINQLLALFGDGHSRLRSIEALRPAGYLPLLVADSDAGPVAFLEDRSAFVDPEFPFLVAIDGDPLSLWVARAARSTAAASPGFARRQSLRGLRLINALRVEAGLETRPTAQLTLADTTGRERRVEVQLSPRKPLFGTWPRHAPLARLEGDIGYLRLASMDSDPNFLAGLEAGLEQLADARGLILDLRGNGGGTRDALLTLMPHMLDSSTGPLLANVARLRRIPGEHGDSLADRALVPRDGTDWSAAQRAALDAAPFEPDWQQAPMEFGAWQVLVIEPGPGPRFAKPVVLLIDSGCFSATDIFIGAFERLDNVTLMGSTSGGGSGRSRRWALAESGLMLSLSTMASFRPGGARYDGLGIAPDVEWMPSPEDFLLGGSDTLLEAARLRLSAQE